MNNSVARSPGAQLLRPLLLACLLCTGLPALAQKGGPGPGGGTGDGGVQDEVLVQLRSAGALGPLLVRHQLSLVSQFGARPIFRLKVVGRTDVNDKIAALGLEPEVLIAEQNFVHQSPEARRVSSWAIGTPGAYSAQWAPQALRLPEAHRLSTGAGVRVAVLDSGVDSLHPALAGRLLAGFDFVDFDTDPSEVGSRATNPSFGHGTHVAGLVALAAPQARIMPLRVLDADGAGNAWVLAEALLHAVDPDRNPSTNDGVQVINLSLGSTSRTRVLDTVSRLASCAILPAVLLPDDELADAGYNGDRDRCNAFGGAVIVAAVGNDASRSIRQYPAAEGVYGLVAVAASNASLRLASFSNYGAWVDLAAPGEAITSTVPGGLFGTWSGTSMAAPLVAGTAALLRSRHPDLTPRQVVRRMLRSSAELCDSEVVQLDAEAALRDTKPAANRCR